MQLNKVYSVKTIDRVAVELGETVNKIFDLATGMETRRWYNLGLRSQRRRCHRIHSNRDRKPARAHRNGP